jgi:hypothetical protein
MLKEKMESVLSGQVVEPFEYILITRNGSRVETLFSLKEIISGTEKLIIGFITDINSYKQSEKMARLKAESLVSYHNVMVGRELKMIELKKEVNKLLILLGEDEKYKIVG